ncbi:MAG: hypothetical protein DRO23_09150 [Thermoprotei archaeon]|nr:MAG: hypothetical protein DRO23_09150 [Thermoprotei archaeon]
MRTYTIEELANRYCRVHRDLLPYVTWRQLYSSLAKLMPFKYIDSKREVIEVCSIADLDKVVKDIIYFVRLRKSRIRNEKF